MFMWKKSQCCGTFNRNIANKVILTILVINMRTIAVGMNQSFCFHGPGKSSNSRNVINNCLNPEQAFTMRNVESVLVK